MAKLRSDSAWSKLTAEQRGKLECWLFEKHLGYRETLELARREFGLKTSLTSLKMYFRRLKDEREAREVTRELEVLMECGGKAAKTPEQVRAAGEKMALIKMFQLTAEGPGKARELAALCRAITESRKMDLEMEKMKSRQERASLEEAAGRTDVPHKSG